MAAGLVGQSFGGFEVTDKLGQGGMGAVYKARQLALERMVALKVLPPHFTEDPAFVERFRREAIVAASLSHPNIVQIHAAGEHEGLHYIVMEFVDGESLRQRLGRVGRIPLKDALTIAHHVARALDHAWNKSRIIHRDIKPDNIFLSNAGAIKVGDLGLAKIANQANTNLTQTGISVGSPHYISPEQVTSSKTVDCRADMYSLGCTLYHMLAGRPPYEDETPVALMFKHVHEPVPDLRGAWPECPAGVARLVARLMAKKPEERAADYRALMAELSRLYADPTGGEAAAAPAAAARTAPAKATAAGHPKAAAPRPPARPARPKQSAEEATAGASMRPPSAPAPKPAAAARRPPVALYAGVALAGAALIAGVFVWAPWKPRATAAAKPAPAGAEPVVTPAPPRPPAETPEQLVFDECRVREVTGKGTFTRPGDPAAPTGDGAFVKELAVLPPEQQAARVAAELKRLNPGYDGRETHVIQGQKVTEFCFSADRVTNVSPIRALQDLENLDCSLGRRAMRKALRDLSPLKGLRLKTLIMDYAGVSDLTPLRGMPLHVLWAPGTDVADFSPLQGMPLEKVAVGASPSGIVPLKDLSPLRGMPLQGLYFPGTEVADLSPLQGMPLKILQCWETRVSDLAPVRSTPLQTLSCDLELAERNAAVLRAMSTVKTINEQPAAAFWRSVDDWKGAVNLLPLIDPQRDAVTGTWTRAAEGLMSDIAFVSRVQLPYRPAAEYDLRLMFTRLEARGAAGTVGWGDVFAILQKDGRPFHFYAGAHGNRWAGFELVDGKRFDKNPTGVQKDAFLQMNRRYAAVVAVRKDSVKAFLNDRLISEWRPELGPLSEGPYAALPDKTVLGIGACNVRTVFDRIEVREVTGKGTLTRAAAP